MDVVRFQPDPSNDWLHEWLDPIDQTLPRRRPVAKLRCDHNAVTLRAKGFSYQTLTLALRVHVCCIEERHSLVESVAKEGNDRCPAGALKDAADARAPEAHLRCGEVRLTETTVLHA